MPFVTEALWPALEARRAGEVPGLALPRSAMLATAAWPTASPSLVDAAVEAGFARTQSLVDAIRTIRGERQIPPRKRIRLCAAPAARSLCAGSDGIVESMSGLEAVVPAASRGGAAAAFPFEGEECWLDGLVDQADAGAERGRLEKLVVERRKAAQGCRVKLDNAGYVAKAPPKVVEETRALLAAAEADLAAAERALRELGA
jgi:valyl-tRNA synthetase